MSDIGNSNPFEERHFTIRELSKMWRLSEEFVRQIVKDEPGVTEWVRQQPGRRRYRVLRIPQSVAERLYHRAQARAAEAQPDPRLAEPQRRSRGRRRSVLSSISHGDRHREEAGPGVLSRNG
jgi:hypothetical protein